MIFSTVEKFARSITTSFNNVTPVNKIDINRNQAILLVMPATKSTMAITSQIIVTVTPSHCIPT